MAAKPYVTLSVPWGVKMVGVVRKMPMLLLIEEIWRAPVFTGFFTSQVVPHFFDQQYLKTLPSPHYGFSNGRMCNDQLVGTHSPQSDMDTLNQMKC